MKQEEQRGIDDAKMRYEKQKKFQYDSLKNDEASLAKLERALLDANKLQNQVVDKLS